METLSLCSQEFPLHIVMPVSRIYVYIPKVVLEWQSRYCETRFQTESFRYAELANACCLASQRLNTHLFDELAIMRFARRAGLLRSQAIIPTHKVPRSTNGVILGKTG